MPSNWKLDDPQRDAIVASARTLCRAKAQQARQRELKAEIKALSEKLPLTSLLSPSWMAAIHAHGRKQLEFG